MGGKQTNEPARGAQRSACAQNEFAHASRPVIRQALTSMDDDNAGRVASVGSYIGGFVCAAGWYVYMAMALKAGQREYEWDCKADPKDLPAHVSAIAPCGFTSGAYLAPGILMSLGVVMLNVIRWTARGDDSSATNQPT